MIIRENVPLAPLTTLQVGGPARYLAEAQNEEEVREATRFAQARRLPLFVLGGGSNLVSPIPDGRDWCLKIAIGDIDRRAEGGSVLFDAGRWPCLG